MRKSKPPIRTLLVGGYFYKEFFLTIQPGQQVRLVKEPENAYDKDAIKVMDADNNCIGHIGNSERTMGNRQGNFKWATDLGEYFEKEVSATIERKVGEYRATLIVFPTNHFFLTKLPPLPADPYADVLLQP